jgi:hypothetical protein
VFEVVGDRPLVAARVLAALGVGLDRTTGWEVAFRAALSEDVGGAAANRVYNDFLALARRPGDAAIEARIREATRGWPFGTTLRVLGSLPPEREIDWTFSPEPTASRTEGELLVLSFRDPPTVLGIPYVDVRARLRVRARFAPDGRSALPGTADATAAWPAAAPEILALTSAALPPGTSDPEARLHALLDLTLSKLAMGGDLGSRHGVLAALAEGRGWCWDRADLLVTLCRAAGLPARERAGWVPPLGQGHVWTEVHLGTSGWIPVDATTPWLGTSSDYVPFFGTEDGRMGVLYLGPVEVRRAE